MDSELRFVFAVPSRFSRETLRRSGRENIRPSGAFYGSSGGKRDKKRDLALLTCGDKSSFIVTPITESFDLCSKMLHSRKF